MYNIINYMYLTISKCSYNIVRDPNFFLELKLWINFIQYKLFMVGEISICLFLI